MPATLPRPPNAATFRKNKSAAYQVGYGKPSLPTQFCKGQTCLGSRIPCSAQGNSLFRTEQGILCNTLMSHREKAIPCQKQPPNGRKIHQIPC
jgi:hypothetical protein